MNTVSLAELLYEQDSSSMASLGDKSMTDFLEPMKTSIEDMEKKVDDQGKNILLIQKSMDQKTEVPTKSNATNGAFTTKKTTPTRAAGTKGPTGTDGSEDTKKSTEDKGNPADQTREFMSSFAQGIDRKLEDMTKELGNLGVSGKKSVFGKTS